MCLDCDLGLSVRVRGPVLTVAFASGRHVAGASPSGGSAEQGSWFEGVGEVVLRGHLGVETRPLPTKTWGSGLWG